ncbi:hypothetical protein GGE45_003940 [Rhizobium aethiopicum]|uniref:LysR substrate-binding domain-containing protein n=1 Tax=Rhizobium aethiopicum TaxID=1138170 RepID=UPI00160A9613|nr:LysR substrate-binding domain-containing protein [Rhizobium aethiopicum]MBB4581592.1 hypothetical protein [Rhizobium aethiopicum]
MRSKAWAKARRLKQEIDLSGETHPPCAGVHIIADRHGARQREPFLGKARILWEVGLEMGTVIGRTFREKERTPLYSPMRNRNREISSRVLISPLRIAERPAAALVSKKSAISDPLADRRRSPCELAQRPLILLDLPETRNYLVTLFDFSAHRPKIGLRTRSYETVRVAVANGLGVSILNMRPHEEASPDNPILKRLPISDPLRQPTLIVADPYGLQKPRYVRAFIDTLYQYVADPGPDKLTIVKPEFGKDLLYPRPA